MILVEKPAEMGYNQPRFNHAYEVTAMRYDEICSYWKGHTSSKAIALEMQSMCVDFVYHTVKIENSQIAKRNVKEIFDCGRVTSYTGNVRSLFEIQNSMTAFYRMLDAFEKREPLSEILICEFHGLLTQGTYVCYAIKRESVQGPIRKMTM